MQSKTIITVNAMDPNYWMQQNKKNVLAKPYVTLDQSLKFSSGVLSNYMSYHLSNFFF